ncbi:MAG: YCF48-related protein [Candidatus Kapaibacterium sp.]
MHTIARTLLKTALELCCLVGLVVILGCASNVVAPFVTGDVAKDAFRITPSGGTGKIYLLSNTTVPLSFTAAGTTTYQVAMGGTNDTSGTMNEYEATSWSIVQSPDMLPSGCTITFNPVQLDNSTGTTTMSVHLDPTVVNGSYTVTIQTDNSLYNVPKTIRLQLTIAIAPPTLPWDDVTPSNTLATLNGVGFATPLVGVVVGDKGTMLRTADGGLRWQTIILSTSKDLRDVQFVNSMVGFAVGKDVFLKTTDGGNHWFETNSTLTGDFKGLCAIDTGSVFIYEGKLSGNRVFSTTNSGEMWKLVGTFGPIYKIVMPSSTNGILISGPSNGAFTQLYRSSDGGTSWELDPTRIEPGILDIYFTKTGKAYGCGYGSSIYTSTNSGSTWSMSTVNGDISDNLYGLSFSGSHGIAIGSLGSIARTTGSGWNSEKSGVSYYLSKVSVINDSNAVAVGYGYRPGSSAYSGVIIRRK